MNRSLMRQTLLALGVLLVNFIAQVPYYLHVYYRRGHALPALRPGLEMAAVFALFAAASVLLLTGRRLGWALTVAYTAMDSAFYLWTIIVSVLAGYRWFFQLFNPDPLLRVIFAIGYLNFFASAYLLVLLVWRRDSYIQRRHT